MPSTISDSFLLPGRMLYNDFPLLLPPLSNTGPPTTLIFFFAAAWRTFFPPSSSTCSDLFQNVDPRSVLHHVGMFSPRSRIFQMCTFPFCTAALTLFPDRRLSYQGFSFFSLGPVGRFSFGKFPRRHHRSRPLAQCPVSMEIGKSRGPSFFPVGVVKRHFGRSPLP